ncbi:Putative Serine/threonine protein kinase-like protein [[Torrubiella] hemipterigena]|uniref:Putative Serine/threonine protein kinase-like protein n=1 Tax=[Torrubiella] hemipterigena TaxID=1531966 RepID=A0A0A1TFI7_9HYPO|nr:Putative Serine/threonine protein kinase-like protein [[Torrubiella] hemipterigena]
MTETVPPDIVRQGSDPKSSKTHGYFDASAAATSASNSHDSYELKQTATEPAATHANRSSYHGGNDHAAFPGGKHASSSDEKQGSVIDGKSAANDESNSIVTDTTNEAEAGKDQHKGSWFQRVATETRRSFWLTITHSWVNVLLVFVPVGIAIANVPGIHPGAIFGVNAIAIIPLAGLLSHATESVAREMGDALGALLNVTFGNAVELIIFIIALVKGEIRIVQASLLGSILANLLLILGMGFFLGGLRFREQVYNSTVTQMSACLLSLSVISLVLPTAFHASFKNSQDADRESLKISRGTSVILLLVYGIYLLFQLKSHAYLYESTPQHIVDAEALPGPAAGWLDTSSSDSSSDSSTDSDTSHDTVRKRMKKVLRAGRKRKTSIGSVDENATRSPSFATASTNPRDDMAEGGSPTRPWLTPRMNSVDTNEVAVEDGKSEKRKKKMSRHRRKKEKAKARRLGAMSLGDPALPDPEDENAPRRVDFAMQNNTEIPAADGDADDEGEDNQNNKRPGFSAFRHMSVRNLAPTVFVQKPEDDAVASLVPAGPVPRVRYGIRRTNSLPDRLNASSSFRAPGGMFPAHLPVAPFTNVTTVAAGDAEDEEQHLTQTSAIILLLITTGLVAACAEFLVGSIDEVVKTSHLREIFIGLIILPIVGNAAEHVTAITVAMKNKMDLAIGVALGSSIQIALFVTPFIVILGWIIGKDMTLYFTLFETVCLFVSAFIVNFLVLDGRSNYLEGALLCAVYLIIAVVAFFYPEGADASAWGQ